MRITALLRQASLAVNPKRAQQSTLLDRRGENFQKNGWGDLLCRLGQIICRRLQEN
jgi:hypothetical protein